MDNHNKQNHSELWNKIYNLVKEIPRENITEDAPDAPSVSTDLENLFEKYLTKHQSYNHKEIITKFRTWWWGNREKIDDITNDDIDRYTINYIKEI
jgi:hypothetical protein